MLLSWLPRRWYWRLTLGVLAFLVLSPCITMFWMQWQGNSDLAKKVAELDASDPDWQIDQLIATRNAEVKKLSPNGWAQIQKVITKLPKGWDKEINTIGEDFNELNHNQLIYAKTLESIIAIRQANPEALKLAREMHKFSQGGRELVVPDNPLLMLLPEVQETRNVMSLLSYSSHEAAIAGRTEESFQDGLNLLNCSRAFGDEPILITQLVRLAGRSIATQATKRTLALGEPKTGLAELQAEYLKEADVNVLTKALRGERASSHKLFVLMASGDFYNTVQAAQGTPPGAMPGQLERIGLWAMQSYLPSNHKLALEKLTEMIEYSKLPFDEQHAKFKAIPKVPRGITTFFVSLLMPAIEKVTEAALRSRGELLATGVGIACERYRQKFGKWPEKLEDIPKDILPSIPNDPFTGKPINYKRLPDGVVVYTVGPDGKDDGGAVIQTKQTKMTDFGIRLWDVDKRRQNPPEPELKENITDLTNPDDPQREDLPTIAGDPKK
jgi:hypothetical protein